MHKRLAAQIAAILALALTVAVASAGPGGLNLGWDDCGGLPASLNKAFACDTNTGVNTLVGSVVAPSGVISYTASEFVIDLQTSGATLAPWWSMRATAPRGCRTPLSQSGDFSANTACFDYWQLNASGGISMDAPVGNRARIKGLEGLPAGSPIVRSVAEGTEIYVFKVNIGNAKTVGLGSCPGCNVGACIVLNMVSMHQEVLPFFFIYAPATRNYALWQGGNGPDCYAATPAMNTTWGAIKAIYR